MNIQISLLKRLLFYLQIISRPLQNNLRELKQIENIDLLKTMKGHLTALPLDPVLCLH